MCNCQLGGPNWCEIMTLAFGVIAGAFALWQWYRHCRVTGAEHLATVLQRFNETIISETFYGNINNAPYGGKEGPRFYLGKLRFEKGVESKIDSMLLLFSEICHNRNICVFREPEFNYFSFQIRRTLAHSQIKDYLLDFALYCTEHGIGFPYRDLVMEGVSVDPDYYRDLCTRARIYSNWFISVGRFIKEATS